MMSFEVERAREWFEQGLPLVGKVDRELALDIELFSRGGQEILNAIERQDIRCAGTASRQFPRCASCAAGRARGAWGSYYERGRGTHPAQFSPTPSQLEVAYSVCRSITRSAAKNFYYAFVVLPPAKRHALCAVYAFMRRCDDITDDTKPATSNAATSWPPGWRRPSRARAIPRMIRCCWLWPTPSGATRFLSGCSINWRTAPAMDVQERPAPDTVRATCASAIIL